MDSKMDVVQQKPSPKSSDEKEPQAPVESARAPINTPKNAEDEDTANEGELSPPPDSSSVSSVNPDMLGDEIIVGTHANSDKPSPFRVTSELGDEDMADAEYEEPHVPHYPKRKRSAVYNDLGEDKISAVPVDVPDGVMSKRHGLAGAKNVILGFWRDSSVPDEAKKHAVIGFMDVRDRLRTRVQNITRAGEPINNRLFPVPPGPGGSWVTFERVVFADHLVGLDHNEIKEYVKVRIEKGGEKTAEGIKRADLEAVQEARRRLEANPPPEVTQPSPIAWGKDIPEDAHLSRPEVKRRRLGSSAGTISERAERSDRQERSERPTPSRSQPASGSVQPLDPLHGTRPTRIPVGVWSKSNAELDRDKHAVFGILGANDMFRVKLTRETLDNRAFEGNFPTGAGALWISYEDVNFLPHIAELSRPEMKEYVRVRQSQLDAGETEADRVANETKAVYEAQTRAAAIGKAPLGGNVMPRHSLGLEREEIRASPKPEPNGTVHELRQMHREMLPPRNGTPQSRYSHPQLEILQANSRGPSMGALDSLERVQNLATREVSRSEAAQMRNERYAANRPVVANAVDPTDNHRQFQEHRDRLQRVWANQEQGRLPPPPPNDEAKFHGGVKYERKQNGPFAGKLVSQGTIISIDGEDYVEYRVLTKPSFF